MKVGELLYSLRLDIKDTNKSVYSDYSLINTFNSVIQTINNAIVKRKSNLITKTQTINLVNSLGTLPNDYIAIVELYDPNENPLVPHSSEPSEQYRITGSVIYANHPSVKIVYRYHVPILGANDDLPVPDWFGEYIKRYMALLLTEKVNKFDMTFTSMVEADISSITSGADYTVIDREPPFII